MVMRKGVLFTLIALLLAGLFILLYTTEIRTPIDQKVDLQTMRINNMHIYSANLHEYIRTVSSVATHHTLAGLTEYAYRQDTAYRSEQELTCHFGDLIYDGQLQNITINKMNLGDKIWFNLSNHTSGEALFQAGPRTIPGFLAGSDQEEDYVHINMSNDTKRSGLWQNFTPEFSGRLNSISLAVSILDDPEKPEETTFEVHAEVYTNKCNYAVFKIDDAVKEYRIGDLDASQPNLLTIEFEQHAQVFTPDDGGDFYQLYVWVNGTNLSFYTNAEYYNELSNGYDPATYERPDTLMYDTHAAYLHKTLNQSTSLKRFFDKFFNISENYLRVRGSITFTGVELLMEDTFVIETALDVLYHVEDGHTSIRRTNTQRALTPLRGLNEPLASYHDINRTIVPSPLGIEHGLNLKNITYMIENELYWERYRDAPNYIQRFLNITPGKASAGHQYGYESILFEDDSGAEIYGVNLSNADWLYFNGTMSQCQDMKGMDIVAIDEDPDLEQDVKDYWQARWEKMRFHRDDLLTWGITQYWNDTCQWPDTFPP